MHTRPSFKPSQNGRVVGVGIGNGFAKGLVAALMRCSR